MYQSNALIIHTVNKEFRGWNTKNILRLTYKNATHLGRLKDEAQMLAMSSFFSTGDEVVSEHRGTSKIAKHMAHLKKCMEANDAAMVAFGMTVIRCANIKSSFWGLLSCSTDSWKDREHVKQSGTFAQLSVHYHTGASHLYFLGPCGIGKKWTICRV